MWFSSIKFRLLLPQVVAAGLAALLIAAASFVAGRNWALGELEQQRVAIEDTLRDASFPITKSVAESLASLLSVEIAVLDSEDRLAASTIPIDEASLNEIISLRPVHSAIASQAASEKGRSEAGGTEVRIGDRVFLVSGFERKPISQARRSDRKIALLFDQQKIAEASRRAAMLPLLTGLSTILLLTTVTLVLSTRLASRIERLQQSVRRVAGGDFEVLVSDQSRDELGQLGVAVDKMSTELRGLWTEVNRRQSERILHQLAAGMAHQLRNTLTGARLALQLHREKYAPQQVEIAVAFRELKTAEDHVQRLLLVGTGEQQRAVPTKLEDCLSDLKDSQSIVAAHRGVTIDWQWTSDAGGAVVSDGGAVTAAVSNLVLNAIQVATRIHVKAATSNEGKCEIVVSDDGPGIDSELAENLFEPFVTTNPEGMGLGLPVVKRAVHGMGGSVDWRREDSWTRFVIVVPIQNAAQF